MVECCYIYFVLLSGRCILAFSSDVGCLLFFICLLSFFLYFFSSDGGGLAISGSLALRRGQARTVDERALGIRRGCRSGFHKAVDVAIRPHEVPEQVVEAL